MGLDLPYPLRALALGAHPPFGLFLVAERGPGGPGDWDGQLYLAHRPVGADGWEIRAWRCATRPGLPYLRSPVNPHGTATIAPGVYPDAYTRGLHRGRSAIVQRGRVEVLRDPDTDANYEPTVRDVGSGLNVHDIGSPNELAGCIGLSRTALAQLLAAYDATRVQYATLAVLDLSR